MKIKATFPFAILAALATPLSAVETLAGYNSGVTAAAGQTGAADPAAQSWTRAGANSAYSGAYDSGNGGWRTVDGTVNGYASYTHSLTGADTTKLLTSTGWTLTWTVALDKDAIAVPPNGGLVTNYYLSPNNARQNDIVTAIDVAADNLGIVVTHMLDSSNTLLLDVGGTTYNTGIIASAFPTFGTFSLTYDRSAATTTLNYGAGTAVVTTGAPAVAGRTAVVFGANSQAGNGSAVWNNITFQVPDATPPRDLVWTGGASGTWNTAAQNWKLPDNSPTAFAQGDNVTFPDGAAHPAVTVAGSVVPGTVTFDNPTLAYSLAGDAPAAGGPLVKRGAAELAVTANLSQIDGLQIENGPVIAGDGATSGAIPKGAVSVATGGSLTFFRSDTLDFKATPKLRNVSGGGDIVLTGGVKIFNYTGAGLGFADANSWAGFSGNLIIKGGSEFQTIRNGATAMGTGTIVLGEATTSGTLSQIEGNWTWLNDISIVGPDNRIVNRSTPFGPRSLKLQGILSGTGKLTFEDAAASMTDPNLGFILTNDDNSFGSLVIPAGVPLRIGGIPGNVDLFGTGGDAAASGSLGTTPVDNEGTLTFSRTDAHTVAAPITGFGAVRIGIPTAAGKGDTSAQIVTFATAQNYSGDTLVERGTLMLNASLPDSVISVRADGVLAGAGSAGQYVNIVGALAPGDGVGTFSGASDVLFDLGSKYQWQVADWTGAAGTGYDTLAASSLSLYATGAEPMTVVVSDLGLTNFAQAAPASFTLVSTTGGITGFTGDNVRVDSSGFSGGGAWTVTQSGNKLMLNYAPGGPYDNFESANGIAGAGAGADSDNDGIPNGVEFVIGGDPSGPDSDTNSLLPTITNSGADLVFAFHLTDAAAAISPAVWSVETDEDLAGAWTPVSTGISIAADGNGPNGAPWSKVEVTIPKNAAAKLFARLRVEIP